jgi:hypothetical protein
VLLLRNNRGRAAGFLITLHRCFAGMMALARLAVSFR